MTDSISGTMVMHVKCSRLVATCQSSMCISSAALSRVFGLGTETECKHPSSSGHAGRGQCALCAEGCGGVCRLASRFGDYRPNDPASFTLNENMAFYPQFMFNLRRSQFVQVSSCPHKVVPPLLSFMHAPQLDHSLVPSNADKDNSSSLAEQMCVVDTSCCSNLFKALTGPKHDKI